MSDAYFSRPCPACQGKVRYSADRTHAVCTSCGKKFQLKQNTPPPEKKESAGKEAYERAKEQVETTYREVYHKLRDKEVKIPLPRPKADRLPEHPDAPMDEGQAALYRARKKQLESRGEAKIAPPPPTKGEKFESFITRHRRISIAVSSVIALLLLALMTLLITYCVKESRINKSDFRFSYGDIEPYTEKATYKFVTDKGKTMKINMSALAELCDLTLTGTPDTPKYAVRDGSSYVIFTKDSTIALVNGNRYEMTCPAAYDEKGKLWIDLAFADNLLSGVTVTVDLETNTVTAKRNPLPGSSILNPVYETIVISAGNQSIYTPSGGTSTLNPTYRIDISPYAADLRPSDPSYLLLTNKDNPLTEDHIPTDLVALPSKYTRREIELRSCAARALEAMLTEMAMDGITDIFVTSGYRSYSYQKYLFDYYVNLEMSSGLAYADAVKKAEGYSAHPGYSEHQTGLCVDFMTSTMSDLDNSFLSTEASKWLKENAWRFGFILRYPEDKVNVTQYDHESWHYRFVGVDAAAVIHQNGWCFEEYIRKS